MVFVVEVVCAVFLVVPRALLAVLPDAVVVGLGVAAAATTTQEVRLDALQDTLVGVLREGGSELRRCDTLVIWRRVEDRGDAVCFRGSIMCVLRER